MSLMFNQTVKLSAMGLFPPYIVVIFMLLLTSAAEAAETTVTASFLSILERTEAHIEDNNMTLVDAAQTDRFAILYITRPEQGTTTITLFTLPEQDTRVTVRVHTDSPADPRFDTDLLTLLTRLQD